MKSLGNIEYPVVTIEEFVGSTGSVTIKLEGSGKYLRLRLSVSCARRIADLAREIVGKQRNYALDEWNEYLRLKKHTGYQSPDGKE